MARASGEDQRGLIATVLSRPDLFPEQFLSWLRRFISDNSLIHVSPAQGGGGGGTTTAKRHLIFNWQYQKEPGAPGAGGIWETPTIAGASVNFTMTKVYVVFSNIVAGANTIKLQRSTDGGVTFVDIASSTVTVSLGRTGTATVSQAISSGDLIQVFWNAIADVSNFCSIQFEGDQT